MAAAAAVALFALFVCPATNAYRILAYEPSAGHSHWNVMSAVLESLVDAGHEVVCATLHPATEHLAAHPNYTHVDISAAAAAAGWPEATALDRDLTQVMNVFGSNGRMVGIATDRARGLCTTLCGTPEMRDVLDGRDGRRYDAVIMESLFSECQWSLLPDRLRLPVVYVVPSAPVNWMPVATGSPGHPSYLGTLLAGHPTPDTFVRRLWNAADHAHTNLVRWYRDEPYRGGWPATAPNTMVFVNTHHSVEPARPLGPNVLEIGGIHLRRPVKRLPRDLAEILDKSNEFGVIVFTFGSLVAVNSLPENVLDALKIAFSQLPQTIIWKYENDHMPNKPKNAVLCKWLPQRDILQHPNVKLFISHGGMSGLYEVVDAGVPVLGVPLFYDQPRNIQNLVDLGMALSLDINSMTKTTITSALNRLLNDQRIDIARGQCENHLDNVNVTQVQHYSDENARRVSSLFRDRLTTPADSVVYWTKYLIQHGAEANIRPLSADASWTSYFMMDMCAALVVTIFVLRCCARAVRVTLSKFKQPTKNPEPRR